MSSQPVIATEEDRLIARRNLLRQLGRARPYGMRAAQLIRGLEAGGFDGVGEQECEAECADMTTLGWLRREELEGNGALTTWTLTEEGRKALARMNKQA